MLNCQTTMKTLSLVSALFLIAVTEGKTGPCIEFLGRNGSFREFIPNNFNVSHTAHFSLEVQTLQTEGVLLYLGGPHDYEALFMSQGKLYYMLMNPAASGMESSVGGIYHSSDPVNNGTWLQVDLWRNWRVATPGVLEAELRTGLSIRDTDKDTTETHFDNLPHNDVVLFPRLYLGGVDFKMSQASAPSFRGRIRHLFEERNNEAFEAINRDVGSGTKSCRGRLRRGSR